MQITTQRANPCAFTPGPTRYFQVFYRTNPSEVCDTGQNSSQAVEVTYQL